MEKPHQSDNVRVGEVYRCNKAAFARPCSPSISHRYDDHNHEPFPVGDPSKRAFTYFVLTGGRFIYAAAIRLAVLKFVLSMSVRVDDDACGGIAMFYNHKK